MSNYNHTLWGLLIGLFGRTEAIPLPPSKEENLNHDWEWMLSTAEELALHQEQERVQEIRSELHRITKASNSIQIRPRIGSLIRETFTSLPEEDQRRLLQSRLDASKRDRILKDLIREETSSWKRDFSSFFEQDLTHWKEEKYKKNITGEMASMAFRASHSAQEKGLTPKICGDILWSISVCLSKEIDFPPEKRAAFDDLLLEKIASLITPLLDLWKKTATSVGNISGREGRLPSIWAQEAEEEKDRLAQLKKIGLSARYNDGPSDSLWRKHQESLKDNSKDSPSREEIISHQTFANRKRFLAANLFGKR